MTLIFEWSRTLFGKASLSLARWLCAPILTTIQIRISDWFALRGYEKHSKGQCGFKMVVWNDLFQDFLRRKPKNTLPKKLYSRIRLFGFKKCSPEKQSKPFLAISLRPISICQQFKNPLLFQFVYILHVENWPDYANYPLAINCGF